MTDQTPPTANEIRQEIHLRNSAAILGAERSRADPPTYAEYLRRRQERLGLLPNEPDENEE